MNDSTLFVGALALLVGCQTSRRLEPPTKTGADPPPIRTALLEVHPRVWPAIVKVQGSLMADEVSTVGAKLSGRVAWVHVDLGDSVEQGAPLVTLDQDELRLNILQGEARLSQARAAVGLEPDQPASSLDPPNAPPAREAKAVWDEAAANTHRLSQLMERQAVSDAQLEQATSAERVAEARYASALNGVREKLAEIAVRTADLAVAQQRLQDAVTVAPFAGQVQARFVAPGLMCSWGSRWSRSSAPVRCGFVGRYRNATRERVTIGQTIFLRIESFEKPWHVQVTRVSPALDEATRSLSFEAIIENAQGTLRPGLFAEAELILEPNATAIVVPTSAVVEFAGAGESLESRGRSRHGATGSRGTTYGQGMRDPRRARGGRHHLGPGTGGTCRTSRWRSPGDHATELTTSVHSAARIA